jgi:phospholipid/cholesterol/gamma-HCH transport system substrate-binding protein
MTGAKGFFKTTSDIYTYMGDSAALVEGSPVRLNGILIGQVSKVGLSGVPDPGRVVKATLSVQEDFFKSIPVDSTAKLAAENLLGTKYINITRGRSRQTIMAGAEIASANTPELEDLFQQGFSSLGSLDSILKKLNDVLDEVQSGKGTIGQLLVDDTIAKKIVAVLDNVHQLSDTLTQSINSPDNSVGKLLHDDHALYDDVTGSVTRINTLLDTVNNSEGTFSKFVKDPALYDDLRMTVADVRNLLAGLNRGEGTAGKLLKSDELHEQFKATIARLDSLLDKINNGPGTVGQLLNNPQLYEDIDGTTRELQGLLKDFRANPKKFLHIKIGLF